MDFFQVWRLAHEGLSHPRKHKQKHLWRDGSLQLAALGRCLPEVGRVCGFTNASSRYVPLWFPLVTLRNHKAWETRVTYGNWKP